MAGSWLIGCFKFASLFITPQLWSKVAEVRFKTVSIMLLIHLSPSGGQPSLWTFLNHFTVLPLSCYCTYMQLYAYWYFLEFSEKYSIYWMIYHIDEEITFWENPLGSTHTDGMWAFIMQFTRRSYWRFVSPKSTASCSWLHAQVDGNLQSTRASR